LSPFKDGLSILMYFLREGIKKRLGVGISSFLISELLLYINFYLINIPLFWSILFAGECSVLFGYVMEVFLFRIKKRRYYTELSNYAKDLIRYNIIFLPALAVSVNVIVILFYFLAFNPLVTNFILSFLMFPINYELYTFFNRGHKDEN